MTEGADAVGRLKAVKYGERVFVATSHNKAMVQLYEYLARRSGLSKEMQESYFDFLERVRNDSDLAFGFADKDGKNFEERPQR